MTDEVLLRLRCPACGDRLERDVIEAHPDGAIETGVVWCVSCREWYPVEGTVLELLPPALAYAADRAAFAARHAAALARHGLGEARPPADRTAADEQRKQQEHFDWYAANGEQTYAAYERMPFWEATDDLVFGEWRRELRPGAWVLDVGCAQGRSSFHFADLPVNLVGFDVSKALVRQATARHRAARQAGSHAATAVFFVSDGSNLPFVDEAFDFVLIYGVLHHLPKPETTCREVARVLRPGGVYFGSENNQTVFRRAFDWLMRRKKLWHEEAGAQPLISARDFHDWFADTGIEFRSRTHVFVPPHLVNLLGRRAGGWVLGVCDVVGGALPGLRRQGGLINVRGCKTGRTAA